MRYTYQFTQVSRYENGNLVPVTEKPHKFIFTFGNTIDKILGNNKTVLFTKDMWKESPANNKELLHTVCFAKPSLKGFCRPLIMTKEADKREGVYEYEEVGKPINIKDGQYLSDEIRDLTAIFVEGIRAINEPAKSAPWDKLEEANIKYLMFYIRSEVYKYLLQDRDNKGMERAEEYLKNVLLTFFSLIPDTLIDKFDEGLKAHDNIRSRLEGIPQSDEDTITAILKSQGHFNRIEDFNHFIVLRKYILDVKNFFNHFVWVMFRSKFGMSSLKKVKGQLSATFEFMVTVQNDCGPLEDKEAINKISSRIQKKYRKNVEDFLTKIFWEYEVLKLNKQEQAFICYEFQEKCHWKYLNSRYRYVDAINEEDKYKPIHQEEFRDLCLRFWGINAPNSYKPNKYEKFKKEQSEKYKEMFREDYYKRQIWELMKIEPKERYQETKKESKD